VSRRWTCRLAIVLALSAGLVLLSHPLAGAASDVWGNVGPASPLGPGGLFGRYPLGNYALDQHFDAVSASLTGGVDVSGVPPMIAYFLASVLWALTSFLANLLISLFSFAFSLDLLNGSAATGGAGALAPVSEAIHSIYAKVFGGPWLVAAVAVVGVWAMWRALVQRRYSETAGALGLSLIYVILALFFVAQPAATIGAASAWTNRMSESFLAISDHGSLSGARQATDDAANELFDLLVFKPWAVLEFGGLEHCAIAGSGSGGSDPESAPVRPLSSDPSRDATLARRLASGTEVTADGKVCVNNANKYASHFLRFGPGTDERGAEYEALNDGDSSELPEADTAKAGYRLGVADKPATDAMEAGGQYQRLLLAIVVFCGELGAFCLLGSLSVGIILAQILLLLLLAFAPVALVAAAIPGRGHDFFKGWLEKLAGYLLRKAAYSLILAVLLAVNSALASATSALGWLMSFGLQALFFWAVFLQRKALAESLIGIATGPRAPGRDGSLRVLALYGGARVAGRTLGPIRRRARSATRAVGRLPGGTGSGGGSQPSGAARPPSPHGASHGSAAIGGTPTPGPIAPTDRPQSALADAKAGERRGAGAASAASRPEGEAGPGTDAGKVSAKGAKRRARPAAQVPATKEVRRDPGKGKAEPSRAEPRQARPSPPLSESVRREPASSAESELGAELRAERERAGKAPKKPAAEPRPDSAGVLLPPRRRSRRRKGGGR
jgi:hypothetical protein